MEVDIIEGDMILVTSDKEAEWWSVDDIDIGEEWIPSSIPEMPTVRHYPVFWCTNKEGETRSFVKGEIDRHEPTGRR